MSDIHIVCPVAMKENLCLRLKNSLLGMNEQQFRDYHMLLVEPAEQIFSATEDVGERVHRIGGTTPCSISEISEQQRLKNKNEEPVAPNGDE